MRYFSSDIILFTHARINLKMKPLWACIWCCFTFPHNWEKILIFSVFWFLAWFLFLVYLKTKNISLYFYLPTSFSELSNCMISNNRGIYDVMSQKTTPDSLESQSHSPRPEGVAASMLGCRRCPMQGQHL